MATRKAKASSTARGLGWKHQQRRAALLRKHIDGTPCWWCGEPMYKTQGLAADHTHPRAHGGQQADRLLHGQCNSERGDGSRDHQRPAITGQHLKIEHIDLGHLSLPWP